MNPTIAVAGVDARTNPSTLQRILETYPHLEVGLLYSFDPDGRKRYPTRSQIAKMAETFKERCALHVCGSRALQQILMGDLGDMVQPGMRIQVNGKLPVEAVEDICDLYPDHVIITQFNPANMEHLDVRSKNHQLLVDSSGGEGKYPDTWPALTRHITKKHVGFAGGLNAANLAESMKVFAMLRGAGGYWIDIETAARNKYDDYSLHLVEYFCKIHAFHQSKQTS